MPLYTVLRRLIPDRIRTKSTGDALVTQNSKLLELPAELIHSIADFLPPLALLSLYLTCGRIRSILLSRRPSDKRKLLSFERQAYLATLTGVLRNYYYCEERQQLHRVRYKNRPYQRDFWGKSRCSVDNCWLSCLDDHGWRNEYFLAQPHIHTAIKYSRMTGPDAPHRVYMAKLMKPRTSVFHCRDVTSILPIKPYILNGMFILSTRWLRTIPQESLQCYEERMRICSHLALDHHRVLCICHKHDAIVRKDTTFRGSCNHCPTDFEVLYQLGRREVRTWEDLGTGDSPDDASWRSHVGYERTREFLDSEFPYEHGSIRAQCCHS